MVSLQKNPIIYGTLILSFSGLLCRGIGFFYRLFISRAFGEEAMGVFQLTAPVMMLAFSLTCAGMQTAISRYAAMSFTSASAPAKNSEKSVFSFFSRKNARHGGLSADSYLFAGLVLSALLSAAYSMVVYLQADWISLHILKESRCALLLRLCALAFPFSALHCCFNGYFYGKKETGIPSFCQLAEQLIRVSSVFLLYYYFVSKGQTPSIALTCIGMLFAETVSLMISIAAYFFYYNKNASGAPVKRRGACCSAGCILPLPRLDAIRDLLGLFLPLTLNRVIVNLLQSYETISIPVALREYGYSQKAALSIYGVLTGMALSLIFFPSTFTNSAAVLLLPTVSEAASAQNMKKIRQTILRAIAFSLLLGGCCTFAFFVFGNFLGNLLFDSTLAGSFITALSFLCPFVYLHTTLSSILNGLKKTTTTLLINIFSMLIHLMFILVLIPQVGISGFIWGMLVSEIFSAGFSFLALKKYIF